MGQTVAIAGHRTTYLAPFRFINELRPGDRIFLTMPYGKFTYVVQYQRIVKPTQTSVIDDVGYERLVLSACNPLYSAAQRIIVVRPPEIRPAARPGPRPPGLSTVPKRSCPNVQRASGRMQITSVLAENQPQS